MRRWAGLEATGEGLELEQMDNGASLNGETPCGRDLGGAGAGRGLGRLGSQSSEASGGALVARVCWRGLGGWGLEEAGAAWA